MSTTPKTSVEFEKQYVVLNAAQKQAVDTIEGPVMVIAGPGTGKTTILTLRIANILKATDAAPENILALTFTESGAFAMRRKLLSIIGPAAYKVNIHTFHGFAEHLIQQYPDYFPRIIGSAIITEAEQLKIIEHITSSRDIKILRPYGDPTYYVKSILHEIHILKRENVSPAELKESVKKDLPAKDAPATEREKIDKRNEKNLELAKVFAAYEKALAEKRYYDFDDMLLELIRTMEAKKEFKLILQETYQYILADEHQDANAAQNRILELLSDFHDSPNLFIVGDDKQAIYRFQGASLENFLYFNKKYPQAVVIDLEHNYRSHQGILDASHSLIVKNPTIPGHARTHLISLQIGGKPIYVDECATTDDELDHISFMISGLIQKGEKPEEIAVLYRENKQAEAVSRILKAKGVPHRIESDHNILQTPEAVKILLLTRAIHDPSNSEALARALFLPELGCDPAELAEFCAQASREKKPLYKLIAGDKGSVGQAYGRIRKWSGEAQSIPFTDFLQKLIQETGLVATIAASADSLERLTMLDSFYSEIVRAAEAKRTFYLADFMEYISLIEDHGLMSKRSYADHVGGVRLMTAHRSKGLEFNHVFIIRAEDGVWGNRIKRTNFVIPLIEHARDAGRIEDERRLFYVAMTRARESVTVTYARVHGDRDTVKSQFIEEIDPALVAFSRPTAKDRAELFKTVMTVAARPETTGILDPGFVRSKFLSQPFSVTHLNNYLACPWQYFFVNLVRIPQAPTKHQMYGTAIHAALRAYFDAYRDDRTLSKRQLMDLFKHYLLMQPMSADDREDSEKKGREALSGYIDEYEKTWNKNLLTEFAPKGAEIVIGEERLQLTGKLDKIEFIRGEHVAVIDYKTSKPKSRNELEGKTKNADGNYKRQLVFYKLLLDLGGKYAMNYGEIDFVEPNERGLYKKEKFEITSAEVKELKKLLENVAREILNMTFVDGGCGEKDCEYCTLGELLRPAGK